MNWATYAIGRLGVAILQSLPLRVVARMGRAAGAIAWWLDARHRGVALDNLALVFGREKSNGEIRTLAAENFRRIGESLACAAKTASMNEAEIRRVLEVKGMEKFCPADPAQRPGSAVFAIGHFGNFELFAPAVVFAPGYRFATTYRALPNPGLNRLLQEIRVRSGCLFFERRFEAEPLRNAMNRGGLVLGLLTDQHGGRKGVWGPWLGRECSTTPAPAIFALRYKCPLHTAICHRTGLGTWCIEVGDRIPTHENGQMRAVEAITSDINRAFEVAVLRDPANWFWVHRRWKPRGRVAPTGEDADSRDD